MYWDAENSERRCISVVTLKQSLCFLYTVINKRIININLFSWISNRVRTTSQFWLVKMKNPVFLWAFPINVFIFTFSSLSIRCRNLSTKHIGFSWKPNVKRMEEPSSLSWSNRYDLAYGRIHQSLSQEQGQPIDGPLQNEVEFQQLGNQNQEVMAFHQTAEQRQEDLNVQGQSVSDELHDYQRASSLQQFSFTPTASGENRRVSWGEIL